MKRNIISLMILVVMIALAITVANSSAVTKPSQFYSVVKSIQRGAYVAAGNPLYPTGSVITVHSITPVDIDKSFVLSNNNGDYTATILTNSTYLTTYNYNTPDLSIFYQIIEYY